MKIRIGQSVSSQVPRRESARHLSYDSNARVGTIDDAQEAFRVAAERNTGAIKVVIEP